MLESSFDFPSFTIQIGNGGSTNLGRKVSEDIDVSVTVACFAFQFDANQTHCGNITDLNKLFMD